MRKTVLILTCVLTLSACAPGQQKPGSLASEAAGGSASNAPRTTASAGTGQGSAAAQDSLTLAVKNYRQLKLMTEQPHPVDMYLSMLCRGAMKEDITRTDQTSGPHARSTVNIYTNSVGEQALRRQTLPYPEGTLIIKEKNPQEIHYFDDTKETRSNSIGGMRKREKGYDPEHGDWEYFFQPAGGAIESGKIASCIQCHTRAQKQDYVFRNWMQDQVPPLSPQGIPE